MNLIARKKEGDGSTIYIYMLIDQYFPWECVDYSIVQHYHSSKSS
jgi:hypothetical protein